jgi:Protein of unknown function (DUF3667)
MSEELEAVGALATAGLAGGVLEAGKGAGAADRHGHDGAAHRACLNCGAALDGAFCRACGQPAHVHRSLLHFVEELLHGVFHFDAKGWRTLPLLVGRPGLLTRRYVDGQRVRYVSPLALFLFTIFLMFFVASLSGGPPVMLATSEETRVTLDAELAQALAAEAKARSELAEAKRAGRDVSRKAEALASAKEDVADARKAISVVASFAKAASAIAAGPEAPGASAASAPAGGRVDLKLWPTQSGERRFLDKEIKHALANPDLTLYKLKSSAYKFAFLLVPISLPFVWLLFVRRRDLTLYDHAVFVLYSLSFMSLLFVLLSGLGALGLSGTVLVLMLLVPPVHMALQLKEAYGLGAWATAWRTVALLLVASVVFAVFALLVGYVAIA